MLTVSGFIESLVYILHLFACALWSKPPILQQIYCRTGNDAVMTDSGGGNSWSRRIFKEKTLIDLI